jgi:pyruvate,water dikinase
MAKKFTDPHDVPTIPGTEGWEKLYPYQYIFSKDDPERAKYESDQIWYYDGLHYPDPEYPFDLMWDEAWYMTLSQYNSRHWIIPPALGIDHRIVNGYVYISPVAVPDPNEIPKRAPLFMERAGYYYDNWNDIYANWEKKMKDVLAKLEALDFKELPEMEDISVIKDMVGQGSGFKLLKQWDDLINLGFLCWQYHFEMLNLAYAAQVTFFATANDIFPDVPTSTLMKMSIGMEAMLFKPHEELIKLSKLAIDKGLTGLFEKPMKADELMNELDKTPAGKEWLQALEKARFPWFYISTGTGWFHTHICWNDNLNIPFESIRVNIKAIQAGKNLDRPTEQLLKERDRIANEYRALIKSDTDREAFDQCLAIARLVLPYAENHTFYVEHWFHSVFWGKVRQVGRILGKAGFFENGEEDIFYLKRDEVKSALWDLVTSWATGPKGRGPSYWPKEVAWRKDVWKKMKEWTPPPALGTPPDVVTEPFTIVQWGVTSDVLDKWLGASGDGSGDSGPTDQIHGSPGCSGTVQGPAWVLKSVEELADVQQGEILVATTMSPSWAPAFVKLAGVITDVGGPMCHAAIVAREYGVPTVVGSGKGTSLIKTGDIVKIDGDTGVVKIVERAKK